MGDAGRREGVALRATGPDSATLRSAPPVGREAGTLVYVLPAAGAADGGGASVAGPQRVTGMGRVADAQHHAGDELLPEGAAEPALIDALNGACRGVLAPFLVGQVLLRQYVIEHPAGAEKSDEQEGPRVHGA